MPIYKRFLLGVFRVAISVSLLWLVGAAGHAAPDAGSSPTLQLAVQLPDGGRLLLYEKFVPWSYKAPSLPKGLVEPVATAYYLELENSATGRRTCIWERGYGINFKAVWLGRPRGFALGLAQGYTSPVAIAYWEGGSIRFYEADPARPVPDRFEALLEKDKDRNFPQFSKGGRFGDWKKPGRSLAPFDALYPKYFWRDAGYSYPPQIKKIWREADSWNMQIAVGQPEMHLLLRDGAKEWVWVNKP